MRVTGAQIYRTVSMLRYFVTDAYNVGVKKCREAFKKIEKKCRDKVKVALVRDLLCWPFKITVACKLVKRK